ncbi:MAG: tetratricopeptide repeat protein [Alphaproteobacteria bacterium]|nr:tetratricopeptide repeat protein [Alphaproteobacteria bacterium]
MKHALAIPLACLLAAAAAPKALAQIVMGSSLAEACYRAVEAGDQGRAATIARCEDAFDDQRLTQRDRAATHNNLGILLHRAGRSQQALGQFDRALAIDSGHGAFWHNRGVALMGAQDFPDAITHFTRALELGFDRPAHALYNRALSREQTGDLAGAYHDLRAALEADPGFALARDELTRFVVEPSG